MGDKIRCMIAEDYEPLNNIFVNLLNYEKDIQVIGNAFSGKEIYELVQKEKPDIVLMDVEMETRNAGIEYSEKILKLYPDMKIIILTCYEDEDQIIKAYEAGVVDYVLKNSSSSVILEAIRAAYNDKSLIRAYAALAIRKELLSLGSYKKSLLVVTKMISNLTTSEIEVLKLLLEGKKNKEIAQCRNVEMSTIKYHISSILKKFECRRTGEVVKIIKELGIESVINDM